MNIIDLGLEGTQRIKDTVIKDEYEKLLDPIKERFWTSDKDKLTCSKFYVGKNFGKGSFNGKPLRILYVGRAMNGWENEWKEGTAQDLTDQVFQNDFDMSTISKGIVRDEEGNFIYNYNQSGFWQLGRQLMKLYGIENDWSDYMVWSNLFKVSPMKKGNPNNKIIKKTIDSCARIMGLEISRLRPTHIVFVTDYWWYHPEGIKEDAFSKEIGIKANKESETTILGSGVSEYFHFNPKVIITKRPEGLNVLREKHAEEIFNEFNRL